MAGEAPEAPSVDALAQFMVDNEKDLKQPLDDASATPRKGQRAGTDETAKGDKAEAAEPDQGDDNILDDSEDLKADSGKEDNDAEEDDDDAEAKDRQALKFKVPVKGEDGAVTHVEVDEKELVAGYMRREDHTRKTQELATQETQAYDLISKRMSEGRENIAREIVKVRGVVQRLAALKDDSELAALAATDPAAYSSERARKDAVMAVMRELDDTINEQERQWKDEQRERDEKMRSAAWGELGRHGINKAKLGDIFTSIHKHFGVPMDDFANVKNPKVVLIMQAAARMKEIEGKAQNMRKGGAKQEGQAAEKTASPQLPPPRQSTPQRDRQRKQMDAKFASGKASIKDLASLLR